MSALDNAALADVQCVADMAVSCGAVLPALVLWREDSRDMATATANGQDAPVHG